MKTTKFLATAVVTTGMIFASTGAFANNAVECNWGQLTKEAIADGFPQGPHASDPSGNGKGKDDIDQPRDGLANVVNQGDLHALCVFIREALHN